MAIEQYCGDYEVKMATRDPDGKLVHSTINATLTIDLIRLVQALAARAVARPALKSTSNNGMIVCRVEPAAKAVKK